MALMSKLPPPVFERLANKFTRWVGSVSSIVAHTIFFSACFASVFFGVEMQSMLLFLTTIVSLEAIYLAIMIQYTVNKNTEDIGEIQEDIDEMQEDVDEIQKDVDEIQEDVDEIQKDVDVIQDDVVGGTKQ